MRRNYTKGTWPLYDDHLERLTKSSVILNGKGRNFTINQNLGDRRGLSHALFLLTGDADGRIKNDYGEVLMATIPYLERQLKEVDDKFAYYQRKRTAIGNRALGESIEDWPAEYRNEKLKLQAELSVRLDEKAELEKRIKEFVVVEETENDREIARNVLQGVSTLRGGEIVEIDNCKVIKVNGRFILDDGIYQGMELPDYKDLIKTYKKTLADRDRDKLAKLQEQARKENRELPKRLPIRLGTRPDVSSLPAWPDNVRNYKKNPETGVELEPVKKPARSKQMDVNISTI